MQGGGSPQKFITDLLGRLTKAGSVQDRLRRMSAQELPKHVAHVTVQAFDSEGTAACLSTTASGLLRPATSPSKAALASGLEADRDAGSCLS